MGGGEAAAPAELPSEKTETYTTSIRQHAPPPVIQSCECEGKSLIRTIIRQLWIDLRGLMYVSHGHLLHKATVMPVMVNGVFAFFKSWDGKNNIFFKS